MSHIRVNIDRLVLNGFEAREGKALARALEAQLRQVLVNPATRGKWALSHRTPVIRLGRMPIQTGTSGSTKFGKQVANAVGGGLKP